MISARKQYYLSALDIQRYVLPPEPDPWDVLQATVANCRACDLCNSRTQTVFGRGNKQAEILIVGEAPGYYEDQQGKPFVGKAGQLLNKMLQAISMSDKDVFIANILKCRPPENRNPSANEVATCTPFLESQVALLQPKLIVAVGRVAAHYLLDTDLSLSRLRGQIHKFKQSEIPLIVTYHPAYLLRNPRSKRQAYRDLQTIAEFVHEA